MREAPCECMCVRVYCQLNQRVERKGKRIYQASAPLVMGPSRGTVDASSDLSIKLNAALETQQTSDQSIDQRFSFLELARGKGMLSACTRPAAAFTISANSAAFERESVVPSKGLRQLP